MSKKTELLTKAAKIINEEGIQKLTMDHLAKKSNITKGGVLYHFENKGNLIIEMNKYVISLFEERLYEHYENLSGNSRFTRAYALSTIEFFRNPETALLPAVFISSLEDQTSYELWKETSEQWEKAFLDDSGDSGENLGLRLMCDGIWFSILYGAETNLNERIEQLVLAKCDELERGS